jgi:hypothetical protein
MKKSSVWLCACLVALLTDSCGGDGSKGACVRASGISSTCGDDFTEGQCKLVNGTFEAGKTCASLGFVRN